jgi:transposase
MEISLLGLGNVGLAIDAIHAAGTEIHIIGHTVGQEVSCPCCAHPSSRIQSRYRRTLKDLPIGEFNVSLIIHARRFCCLNTSCLRKIFVERLPNLAIVHARKTMRLQNMLQSIGLELGGEAAARLGKRLHMESSPDTFLRLIRQCIAETPVTPRVVGIDDWSYRRGHTYGTILCDLERHTVIDLLPDRSPDSVAEWLRCHPSIEVVSRDRGQVYIDGATHGAPGAQQIADRWHLLKNLSEALELQLARSRQEKKQSSPQQLVRKMPLQHGGETPKEPFPAPKAIRPRPRWQDDEVSQIRREERLDRYTQVKELHEQGVKHKIIAKLVGVGERTVTRYLTYQAFPERAKRSKQSHSLDPYVPYLVERWAEGCRNGRQLWREIHAQGFTGATSLIYGFIGQFRLYDDLPTSKQERALDGKDIPMTLTSKKASWFFLRRASDLSKKEQAMLEGYLRDQEARRDVYELAQMFAHMLREQQEGKLEAWLQRAEASPYIHLHRFATGLRKDYAAVYAAFSLPWSHDYVA